MKKTVTGDTPLNELPTVLTVEEVASVLRISRTSAYAHVNQYRYTKGTLGIPVIEIGRSLRVPTTALLGWMNAATGQQLIAEDA